MLIHAGFFERLSFFYPAEGQSRFRAKAWPEPVFKYFSKANACFFDENPR
jgi:hypothetical protein